MTSTCVGPYQLIRLLGSGGMGEVWMAERDGLGGASKRVALKILRRDHLGEEKYRDMFLAEARLAMLLNNSNIVQVFEVGQDREAGCYMAMEWVDGIDLATLISAVWARGEQLSLTVTGFIIGELLKALVGAHDFAHDGARRTIVHRDVTPRNVMISSSGEVKLMDFGVARMASEETSGLHVKGKLRYMPPEQLVDEARAPTIDLFSVGGILHELLDGQGFRDGVVDEARLFGMVIRGEVKPLRAPDAVPPELEALRRGLLQANVDNRIPAAREAYRMLARWPGYEDAQFDLEDLVRELSSAGSANLICGSDEATVAVPRDATSRARGKASRSPAPERERGPRGARVVPVVLGLGGLVCGLVSVAVARDSLEPPPRADTIDAAPLLDAPFETPRAQVVPWLAVQAPTVEPIAVPAAAATPKPAPKWKPKPEPTLVGVSMSAPSFDYVEIRVPGARIIKLDKALNSRGSMKLAPGLHLVTYRTEADGDWRHAGTMEIAAGAPTLVQLGPDGALKVSQ